MRHPRGRPHDAGGAGLIEVLVALLVLSVGLLGLARLQGAAMRVNHQAFLRTQALLGVSSAAERVRAGAKATAGSPASHLPESNLVARCHGLGPDRRCALAVEWTARRRSRHETARVSMEIRP